MDMSPESKLGTCKGGGIKVVSPSDYRISGRKGEGTFSEVLKCQNMIDGKLYACKKMKQKYDSIEQVNGLREIQALRRLTPHPNIIDLKEVIFDRRSGTLALICELMDMNIYELIKDRKSYLPEQRVKLYMYQLCKSIYHMHRNGIFHRDVKPENILIKENALKLADFGSCKSVYSKQPYTEYISTRWYRAPECLLTDGFYGHKMDMWGVGCVMFEVMSLRPLFPGSNEVDQIARIHSVVGTPSPAVLQKFRKHQSRHIDFNFPVQYGQGIGNLLRNASKGCVDLISQLCAYDPDARLTAKQALKHPYFKDLRDSERRAREIRRTPSIASDLSATRLIAINKKTRQYHRNHEHRTHPRHHRLHQLPENHMGSTAVSHTGKPHHSGSTLMLPQIGPKVFGHFGSGIPSGYTSVAISNKSTAHGHFLPTIYGEKPAFYEEKPSAKHSLYPGHRHHAPHQHRQPVPSHLPTIAKHPHHTRTGAG